MIEFRKNGQPVRCNRKCAKCIGECKQHDSLTILKCPAFRKKQEPVICATAV